MLKASLGFMFSHGFRARSQPGHHIAMIEFVRARIGKKHVGLLIVFDRLHRKRNLAFTMTPVLFLSMTPRARSNPPATT
jgi:hypothetical protein